MNQDKNGVIHDPKLEQLRQRLKTGISRRDIYRELYAILERKYPKQEQFQYWQEEFNAVIENLDFKESFARYLAKTTYHKVRPIIKFEDTSPTGETACIDSE